MTGCRQAPGLVSGCIRAVWDRLRDCKPEPLNSDRLRDPGRQLLTVHMVLGSGHPEVGMV